MRAAALFVLLLFGAAAPGYAWGPEGHRIACAIAWDEMAEPVRAKMSALLGLSTQDAFAESCGSVDTTHHHVFVPKTARAIDPARDCATGCALTAIDRDLSILKSGAAEAEKARALRTLSHLIADIHQPLNIGFAEDGGGAAIKGTIEARAPKTAARTPLDWANETLWIMRAPSTGYLGTPGGIDYDDTYVQQNRRVALTQLDKAGVRLAAFLTEIFGGT